MSGGSMRGWILTTCVALAFACACGDDDDSNTPQAGTGTAANGASGTTSGSGGGGGASTMDAGIKPLPDGVVGQPCSDTTACGGSLCGTQVTGLNGLTQEDAPGGYCTGDCAADSDCGQGGACIGALGTLITGRCFLTCSDDSDCRDGYLCGAGLNLGGITVPDTCRPAPPTDQLGDNVAGAACSSDDDCEGGTCATMRTGIAGGGTPLPGGYCSGACLDDSNCGAGGVCQVSGLPGVTGGCYQACQSDAECPRDGYRCRNIGTNLRGCSPAPDPLPDNSAGKACSSDADCGGGTDTCASELPGSGFGGFGRTVPAPGGYCTQSCSEEGDCGAGGLCVSSGFVGGTCYKPCTSDTDCREGYTCEMRGGGIGMGGTADGGMMSGNSVCVPVPPPSDADAG